MKLEFQQVQFKYEIDIWKTIVNWVNLQLFHRYNNKKMCYIIKPKTYLLKDLHKEWQINLLIMKKVNGQLAIKESVRRI